MNTDILNGMARAFFACAYADMMEENGTPLHGEIMDQLSRDVDPAAWLAAQTLYMDMERANNATVWSLYDGSTGRGLSAEQWGHYAAMQAMGHGVGLWEYDVMVKVPTVEFGAYSLTHDYDSAGRITPRLLTWTTHVSTCRVCSRLFRVSQEAIDSARVDAGDDGTDSEIADGIDWCLGCACGTSPRGEYDIPLEIKP